MEGTLIGSGSLGAMGVVGVVVVVGVLALGTNEARGAEGGNTTRLCPVDGKESKKDLHVDIVGLRLYPCSEECQAKIKAVKSGKDWGSINEQMAQRGYEPEQIPVNRSREWSKQETLAGMVLIQAGEFTRPGRYYLGEDAQPVEGDSYKVSVSSFYMDKYEVTEEDYCKFLNDGNEGYCTPWYQGIKRDNQGRFVPADPNQSRLPVGGVNYHQARGYAEWAGKRLPTEAEWEYAAGGKESRKFPWGNEAPDETRANYGGKFGVKPVGSFPKGQTPEGVCDLAGSVSEWCADYYSYSDEYYRKAPPGGLAKDPQGPDRGYTRMFKGGCFGTATPLALSVFRRHDRPPLNASRCLGFRCVRSAAP